MSVSHSLQHPLGAVVQHPQKRPKGEDGNTLLAMSFPVTWARLTFLRVLETPCAAGCGKTLDPETRPRGWLVHSTKARGLCQHLPHGLFLQRLQDEGNRTQPKDFWPQEAQLIESWNRIREWFELKGP